MIILLIHTQKLFNRTFTYLLHAPLIMIPTNFSLSGTQEMFISCYESRRQVCIDGSVIQWPHPPRPAPPHHNSASSGVPLTLMSRISRFSKNYIIFQRNFITALLRKYSLLIRSKFFWLRNLALLHCLDQSPFKVFL